MITACIYNGHGMYRTIYNIYRPIILIKTYELCIIEVKTADAREREESIMAITATELKSNLGKYLRLAATEDILITRNGKVVARLSNPNQDRVNIAKSLFGVLPAGVTLEEAREERLNKI